MGNTIDLISKVNEKFARMSKGQKAIATYVTDNSEQAAFMTALKLGKTVGVSESTVVRFATLLGYDGYPEFQLALEEIVKRKLTSVQQIGAKYGKSSQSEIITSVLRADMEKISDTLETIDSYAFEAAVETIINAKNIYVIGIRSCAPLANFLSFYLNMMFGNVHFIQTTSISEIFEQMIRIDEKDVVIGISFPRYSMRTLKAMEFANNRNSKVITITDSVHSPMNLYSSCNLLARSDNVSIVDSLVAPLSVINALVVALCMKRQNEVRKSLETLEEIWSDYQVYGSDEINFLDEEAIMQYPVSREEFRDEE